MITVVANLKGGSGKSTVVFNLGLWLQMKGQPVVAYDLDPQLAVAIDVTFASDHPQTDPKKAGEVKLGKGPVLTRGPNINPVIADCLRKVARLKKIPYQQVAAARGTGTDANAMQLSRGGTATGLISIPNRYMHTPVEVISTRDLDNAVKLIVEFIAAHPATRDYRPL